MTSDNLAERVTLSTSLVQALLAAEVMGDTADISPSSIDPAGAAEFDVAEASPLDRSAFDSLVGQLATQACPNESTMDLRALPSRIPTPVMRDGLLAEHEEGLKPSLDDFYAPDDDDDERAANVSPQQVEVGQAAAPAPLRDFMLDELADELSGFNGLESLKRLFWDLLAYERVDHPLGQGVFPPSVAASLLSARLFARHEGVNLIVVQAHEGRFLRRVRRAALDAAAARWSHAALVFCDYSWQRVAVGFPLAVGGEFFRLAPTASDVTEQARRLGLVRAYSEEDEQRSTLDLVGSFLRLFEGCREGEGEGEPSEERVVDPLMIHLRCLDRYPLMPRQDTQELLRRIAGISDDERRSGRRDEYERCRNQLVLGHLRLCQHVIKHFALGDHRRSMHRTDLTQEGVFGLMSAIDRFDVTRGTEFSTYAVYWVRQAIQRAIHNTDRFFRIPVHRLSGDDQPSPEERRRLGRVLSLSRGEDGVWHEVEDPRFGRSAEPLQAREAEEKCRSSVKSALRTLDPRAREIISLRFGLGGDREHTLQELGDRYGLTRERVRQIEEASLRKLREGPVCRLLLAAIS